MNCVLRLIKILWRSARNDMQTGYPKYPKCCSEHISVKWKCIINDQRESRTNGLALWQQMQDISKVLGLKTKAQKTKAVLCPSSLVLLRWVERDLNESYHASVLGGPTFSPYPMGVKKLLLPRNVPNSTFFRDCFHFVQILLTSKENRCKKW